MWRLLSLLAPAQLVSWGTLYYAIAFLAGPIEGETGWRPEEIFLAFSTGLLMSGLAAARVGRMLSRFGGRRVLVMGSVLAAIALTLIGLSQNLVLFTAGWVLAGTAMALTQYEAAFSTLRQLVPGDFRRAAGWITVTGGLASTLFWPLTHGLTESIGWRATVLCFAALHVFPGLALHWHLPTQRVEGASSEKPEADPGNIRRGDKPIIALLAVAFSATAIVTSTISAHAETIMVALRIPTETALTFLAMIGPMQIAGRLLDLTLASRVPASAFGAAASLVLGLSVALLSHAQDGLWVLAAFVVSYGLANGILTVVRGGIPIELLPHLDYATCLGNISAPTLIARAIAPVVVAWLVGAFGVGFVPGALVVVAAIGSTALLSAVVIGRRLTATKSQSVSRELT